MIDYKISDKRIHQLAQIIAKVNRTFVPKKQDDSHTNLYLDPIRQKLFGRWFEKDHRNLILALNLNTQQFELLNSRQDAVFIQDIVGKSSEEIEMELKVQFEANGIQTNGLTDALHFEIPVYDFANDPVQQISKEGLDAWLHFRALANYGCMNLSGLAQTATETRIWPHHFDTGIYFEPNERLGIGFGLAMEDEMLGAPYFYLSGYPKNFEIDYSQLSSGLGKWMISDNWKGCVLSLEEIKNLNLKEQINVVADYTLSTYNWFLRQ